MMPRDKVQLLLKPVSQCYVNLEESVCVCGIFQTYKNPYKHFSALVNFEFEDFIR